MPKRWWLLMTVASLGITTLQARCISQALLFLPPGTKSSGNVTIFCHFQLGTTTNEMNFSWDQNHSGICGDVGREVLSPLCVLSHGRWEARMSLLLVIISSYLSFLIFSFFSFFFFSFHPYPSLLFLSSLPFLISLLSSSFFKISFPKTSH